MSLISGFTPKGTVWVKNLDSKGRLITKRVLKNNIQYDTVFNKNGTPMFGLITNYQDNTQFAKLYNLKENWFSKLMNFIKRRKPIESKKLPAIDMNEIMQEGTKGQFTVGCYQGATGFANKEVNEEAQKLKSAYLSQIFR